jgi:outer membrane protein
MKKIVPFILVVLISITLSLTISYFLFKGVEKKTGYVQLGKVYDGFELSKNLNAQFKSTATNRKNFLDSLEFQVKNIYTQASENRDDKQLVEKFEQAQQYYQYQKEQIETTINKLETQYNEQIWTQLNEYVKEYGKEKGYDYIFGAEGSGTIMYSTETEDLTEDMILYINNKYQGK